jgi:hypothetical protein
MTNDKINATDKCEASCSYNTTPADTMSIQGSYHAVCYDAQGNVKWEDDIKNLVTTVGKNLTLDTILGNSAAGAVVMGLKGVGAANVADTHLRRCCGWREGYIVCVHLLNYIDRYCGRLLHQHWWQRND